MSREQVKLLANEISLGDQRRSICPWCGERTFSYTRTYTGQIKYVCFRASCAKKGIIDGAFTAREIGRMLTRNDKQQTCETPFVVPSYFLELENLDDMVYRLCVKELSKFNSIKAYKEGRVDVRYDPQRERLVFLLRERDRYHVGAVGRSTISLGSSRSVVDGPKWLNYPNTRQVPLIVYEKGDLESIAHTAVLVEDCFSACAVSEAGVTGVAIRGTNFLPEYIKHIEHFDHIIVALDKDATAKAYTIKRKLDFWFDDVKVMPLDEDLKYHDAETIKELLSDV